MKRTKPADTEEQFDAILTADWHLRLDTPVCRTDDFLKTQLRKINWVRKYAGQKPVLHAGDLFHHWKPSPYLLTLATKFLPHNFYTVYGNHDLPQHRMDDVEKCGVFNLAANGRVLLGAVGHWGYNPKEDGEEIMTVNGRRVLLWHIMTYQSKEPFPGCTAPKGAKLLRQNPQYDLIVTGDNHVPFTEYHEGRLLVNPGSLMRQEAGQIDYKPRVYLYHAKTNTVTTKYIPIEEDAVTREHIERNEDRDNRIDAFIAQLNQDWGSSLSFHKNLDRFFEINQVRTSVKNIVYDSIEQ
jgi:DNA repair exonuclease SbcCD nuclease subunit